MLFQNHKSKVTIQIVAETVAKYQRTRSTIEKEFAAKNFECNICGATFPKQPEQGILLREHFLMHKNGVLGPDHNIDAEDYDNDTVKPLPKKTPRLLNNMVAVGPTNPLLQVLDAHDNRKTSQPFFSKSPQISLVPKKRKALPKEQSPIYQKLPRPLPVQTEEQTQHKAVSPQQSPSESKLPRILLAQTEVPKKHKALPQDTSLLIDPKLHRSLVEQTQGKRKPKVLPQETSPTDSPALPVQTESPVHSTKRKQSFVIVSKTPSSIYPTLPKPQTAQTLKALFEKIPALPLSKQEQKTSDNLPLHKAVAKPPVSIKIEENSI